MDNKSKLIEIALQLFSEKGYEAVGVQGIVEKKNSPYYRMLLGMSFGPPESEASKEVLKLFKEQFNIVNNLFIECVKDHGNMKGRNETYAITFIGMINNYISLYFYGHIKLNDELLYKAVHQFMHGIFS